VYVVLFLSSNDYGSQGSRKHFQNFRLRKDPSNFSRGLAVDVLLGRVHLFVDQKLDDLKTIKKVFHQTLFFWSTNEMGIVNCTNHDCMKKLVNQKNCNWSTRDNQSFKKVSTAQKVESLIFEKQYFCKENGVHVWHLG